jgi:AcrR family transcriptional regulator
MANVTRCSRDCFRSCLIATSLENAAGHPYVGPMERRLTQRGKERRARLMVAAALRFAEQGYHQTSVAEIVDELGVGKGVFYWYFDSKDELFCEILRDAQLSLRRRQQHAIADETDPLEKLSLGMLGTMQWLADNRHMFNLFQFAATEVAFAPVLRQSADVGAADTVKHVKDAMLMGRIPDGDPEMLSHAIIGVTNELARRFVQTRREEPDVVARAGADFIRNGLLGTLAAPV